MKKTEDMVEVVKEVKRLLRSDLEAVDARWECIDEEQYKQAQQLQQRSLTPALPALRISRSPLVPSHCHSFTHPFIVFELQYCIRISHCFGVHCAATLTNEDLFGELSSSEEEEAELAAAAEAGATGDSAAEGAAAAAALGDEDDFEKYAALLDSQLAADAVPAVPADALLATEQLALDPSASSGAVDSPLAKASKKLATDQCTYCRLHS